MRKRCPYCHSYGVVRNRRALWRRLARRPRTYRCIDCEASFAWHDPPDPTTGEEAVPRRVPGLAQRTRRTAVRQWLAAHGAKARAGLASLRQRLWGAPIEVWVVKQIDDDILHLCGIGTLQSEQGRRRVIKALKQGDYHGGVRLGRTGVVLNSRLFTALPPLEALQLEHASRACWQGRTWRVSHVPQRCWQHEGRLVAHLGPVSDQAGLISSEDVSIIREHVDPDVVPAGIVAFQAGAARGDPLPGMGGRNIQEAGSRGRLTWPPGGPDLP
ncbi:hypothetical protein [Halomonas sp. C05BenzN]|uniref:hypothetical protein n=1 Tax=Halomonas sp. C05BenzN TaxID=3411041 RepID=UPI003B92A203